MSGAILLDGGFSSMRDRFDWPTAKRMLSPPAFGGISVEAFLSGIPEHTGLARTPEIERSSFRWSGSTDAGGSTHASRARTT